MNEDEPMVPEPIASASPLEEGAVTLEPEAVPPPSGPESVAGSSIPAISAPPSVPVVIPPPQSAGAHMRTVVSSRKHARLEKVMEMAI